MKKFMIVESPSKCKKIEAYLREIEPGVEWTCLATRGHFRVLKRLNKGVEPVYEWDDEKRKHIEGIQRTLKTHRAVPSHIFLAMDDDREGEAIAWHFATVLGLPIDDTPRITFREITREAIHKALDPANVRHIDMDWVASQQARQVMDRLVGFKVSPFLWKYTKAASYAPNQKQKYASAGRCQTPALRIIYDHQLQRRELEQTAQQQEQQYQTTALFFSNQNRGFGFEFTLRHPHLTTTEQVEAFYEDFAKTRDDEKTAYKIVPLSAPTLRHHAPPQPFQTSTLLQKAHSALQWTTKRTMAAAQDLYQRGLITYHRTESTQYADSFIVQAREYIIRIYGVSYYNNDKTIKSGAAKGGHEAIRVTQCKSPAIISEADSVSELGIDATQLYRLIHKNTIESCMSDGVDQIYEIFCECCKGSATDLRHDHKATWHKSISVPKTWGWRVYAEPAAPTKPAADVFFFQSLSPSAAIPGPSYIKSIVLLGAAGRQPYFSEGSLVERLVSLGIGRPSTYSYIIETLLERGYAEVRDIAGEKVVCREYAWFAGKTEKNKRAFEITEKERSMGAEKKKMVITAFGEKVLQFLCRDKSANAEAAPFSDLFSYDYTGKMEAALDEVANASKPFSEVCANCLSQIRRGERAMSARFTPRPVGNSEEGWQVYWHGGDTFLRRLRSDIRSEMNKLTKPTNTIVIFKNDETEPEDKAKAEAEPEAEKKDPYEYVQVAPGLTIDQDTPAPEDLHEWMMKTELGEHEGHRVLLKNGPFGLYVEFQGQTKSLDKTLWDYQTIDLEKAVALFDTTEDAELVEGDTSPRERPNPQIMRVLTPSLSIRRNKKTGQAYVFYQTAKMSKPRFFPFRGAPVPYQTPDTQVIVEWIQTTYSVLA